MREYLVYGLRAQTRVLSLSTSLWVEWKVAVLSLAGVGPMGGSYGRDFRVLAVEVQNAHVEPSLRKSEKALNQWGEK